MHKVSIKEGVDLLTFDTTATASNLNRSTQAEPATTTERQVSAVTPLAPAACLLKPPSSHLKILFSLLHTYLVGATPIMKGVCYE